VTCSHVIHKSGALFGPAIVFGREALKMGVPRSYERSTYANNWVRGNGHPFSPPTPPYVRVRIRRFRKLSPVGLVRIAARRGASPLGWVSVPASLFLYSASSAVADWQAHGHHEIRVLLPTLTVRAFIPYGTTMPSADFCRWIRRNYSLLSHHFVTNNRSPEVSSTAFRTQPPDLPPVPLMDMDLVVSCQLVRHRRPHHRFLFIGSRLCSTLFQTPPHGAALALRYHFPPSGCEKDFHLQAVEYARHTTKKAPAFGAGALSDLSTSATGRSLSETVSSCQKLTAGPD
jgi:hypothetical protein